jgi:Zn-dependent protease
MSGAFKIGRLSGIDVKIHCTFFLLLAFFVFVGYRASGSLAGALTPTKTASSLVCSPSRMSATPDCSASQKGGKA